MDDETRRIYRDAEQKWRQASVEQRREWLAEYQYADDDCADVDTFPHDQDPDGRLAVEIVAGAF